MPHLPVHPSDREPSVAVLARTLPTSREASCSRVR
jgi:uncharacterized RmlC-like cupin family protein